MIHHDAAWVQEPRQKSLGIFSGVLDDEYIVVRRWVERKKVQSFNEGDSTSIPFW